MKEKLKIMYLNPVGFDAYDSFFTEMIRENKLPNSEVHVTSLPASVGVMDNLEYRTYNTLIASDVIKATKKAAQEGFDALIIGCFYDPHILEAREISGDMIVIGPCQSSLEIVTKLCNRFSVIIGQKKWEYEMQHTIKTYGYEPHLASFRNVQMNVREFQENHDFTASKLLEATEKALNEDYAEAIILGCTLEFGFYKEIQSKFMVPVIDPSIAALKQAEQMAFLKRKYQWTPSKIWSSEPPPEKDLERFGLFQKDYEFGNRILIA
ncbi:aspartate/glutamate racemase family protein [Tenacibaculum sp. nBUS_03]|uniref:aspartate/glutamate racemase family protein n=1 Tax=Tenacibaculum sp. nBUS_03 TaxID=3395320 RepID=UPI003EBAF22B